MDAFAQLLVVAAGAVHEVAEAAHGAAQFPTVAIVGTEYSLLWLLPGLPLFGAALNLAIGHRFQKAGKPELASHIGVAVMLLATLLAWYIFLFQLVQLPEPQRYLWNHLWTMVSVGSFQVDLAFALDPLSMMMVLIILTIGSGIHIYSVGYMEGDKSYWKFFVYLNYFIFSMLLLVMGDNFIVMFFGWEGVGLASYLLIGFWYEDMEKAKAGMKAFVVNRFGDFGFVLGLFVLFWALGGAFTDDGYKADPELGALRQSAAAPTVSVHGQDIPVGPTLNFKDLRNQIVLQDTGVAEKLVHMKLFGLPVLFVIGALLFVGAIGKSAQIPLFVWLPDAMAGPTPVSALIHAATMVTAGVYMVARLNFIYALDSWAMTLVAVTGALTAFFAATIGLFQHDIKKVLAYSTVSQLGYMFIGVGIGAYWAGSYHLLTHAFFKACLFLASGSVILGCHHEQDMRKMGGLRKLMPLTHFSYLIACLSISGFFFFNGFYSKDEILWLALNTDNLVVPGWSIWLLGLIGAAGTSYYMWRSYFMTFWGEYRGESHPDEHGHGGVPKESPRSMTYVLVFLAAGSVVTGALLFMPHVWGIHAPLAIDEWLAPVMAGSAPLVHFGAMGEAHTLELLLQVFGGVVLPGAGFLVARYLYDGAGKDLTARLAVGDDVGPLRSAWYLPIYSLVYDKYRIDELYDATVIRGSLALSRVATWFDQNVIDRTVNLVGAVVRIQCELVSAFDRYGVDGLVLGSANGLMRISDGLKRIQSQTVRSYLYTVLGGALAIVLVNYVLFSAN